MKKIIVMAAAVAAFSVPAQAERRIDGDSGSAGIFSVEHPLPGRSLGGTFTIDRWLRTELPGGDYVAELARAYQERADYERTDKNKKKGRKGDSNWYDATAFAEKSMAAAGGTEVQPWTPAELGINEPLLIDALTIAREGTIRRAAKFRNVAPAACAQMVALLDHWMEQVREVPHSITEPDDMKIGWVRAYEGCWDPLEFYGFPVNSPSSTDNDRRISDEPAPNLNEYSKLLAAAEEYGFDERVGLLKILQVFVIAQGHTSTTASLAYNENLGYRRATFAREIFTAAGVDPARVGRDTKGETQLKVQTPDRTEEYRNRRVVILEEYQPDDAYRGVYEY